jgi:transposase-like protein
MKEICLEKLAVALKNKTVSQVAREFGVGRNTVLRRAKKHGIEINQVKPHLRNLPNLTDDQNDVVNGTLLGDGHLWNNQNRKSSYFKFKQCVAHLAYVEYLQGIMKPFSGDVKFDEGNAFFYTCACPVFTNLRKKWYPEGKKVVPNDIKLNGRILYFWYLDDGANHIRGKSISLYTNGFTKEESKFLTERLKNDLNICSNIGKTTPSEKYGVYFYIRISSKSYFDFMDLIDSSGPRINCMERKFLRNSNYKLYQPRLSELIRCKIEQMYVSNYKVQKITSELGLSLSTVERVIYSNSVLKQLRKKNKMTGLDQKDF